MKFRFQTIFFEATRRCNLHCPMCMASSDRPEIVRTSIKRELSADEVEKHIIEPAHAIGVETISWSGGEFILRPDAEELVRRATRHGYGSTICSNATVFTEERLLRFRDAAGGTLVVAMGINSISNENAWTRDNDNADTLRLLELCEKHKVKRHVVVNVGKHNLDTLGPTLQWLDDHGIPYNRSPFTARGSGREYFTQLAFSREDMERVIHPELRKHANGYISFTPFFLSPELHARLSHGERNVTVPHNPSIGCWVGTWLAINAEGDLSPCGVLLDVINCGNVRDKPLEDLIAESPHFRRLLDRSQLGGKCGRCRYKFTCGGCRALAFFEHGDLMAEDPTCFFEPDDESTICEHEAETNRNFRKYAFMERYAARQTEVD